MSGLYVYGIVSASTAVEAGSEDVVVERVPHGAVAALATPTEETAPRLRRRDLVRHSDVLQRAIEATTVLPLRFGTVFASREALVEDFLRPRHEELVALLADLDGSVELSFKAVLREDVHLAELVAENPAVARLSEATRRAPEAASYFDRIRLGELVAEALAERRAAYERRVLERLRPLARATAPTGEAAAQTELGASFLVSRGGVGAFEAAAEELASEAGDHLECRLLGPLPPYSFVGLENRAA